MIRQSDIGTFVSLIKSLKKQLSTQKAKASSSHRKSLVNFKQVIRKSTSMCKRVFTSKDNVFDGYKNFHHFHEDSFAQFRIENRSDIQQRKKIYQLYCQQKKRKVDVTTRARADMSYEGGYRTQQLKFPHQRSSSNFCQNQNSKKFLSIIPDIPKQPNLLNINVLKNEFQQRQTINTKNNQRNIKQRTPIQKMKPDTNISLSHKPNYLIPKTRTSNHKHQPSLTKMQLGQAWILDAWQQPSQTLQQFESRHA